MSKFVEGQWEMMLEATREGGDITAACWYAGLNPRDVITWLSYGYKISMGTMTETKTRKGALEAFIQYSQAKGYAVMRMTRALTESAGNGEWRASLAWLEKQHGSAWGKFSGMDERELPQIEGA